MKNEIMKVKARDAYVCYEDLCKRMGATPETKVVFQAMEDQYQGMKDVCYKDIPFPGIPKAVLLKLRLKAVNRLFEEEKVIQTAPAASILAFDDAMGADIAKLRGGTENNNPVVCDIATAGLQLVRLYLMCYRQDDVFKNNRYKSATRVDNALNGSFYKYKTKDGKYFSAHVYYESQKRRMMKLLGITKDPDKFALMSLPFDKKTTAKAIEKWKALELEEATFEKADACGCMLRDRSEWENSEVGKAVCQLPLSKVTKVGDAPTKSLDADVSRGPLTGLKVVDLTHIIAGPACTRLLAEQGASVTLIRRGQLKVQEQAMLELDGWAGKHTVDLDFNKSDELEKAKQLIREADVVVSSYQQGALDRFGLSKEEILAMNPSVIYGEMMCFSDTVWRTRPGWAPLAEDITGLSIRNGSRENPVNLNGVPLDYIPGFIMAGGILKAIKLAITDGGSYVVTGSLTRGGYWLHECTDICDEARANEDKTGVKPLIAEVEGYRWREIYTPEVDTSCGKVRFPLPATYQPGRDDSARIKNMEF